MVRLYLARGISMKSFQVLQLPLENKRILPLVGTSFEGRFCPFKLFGGVGKPSFP